MKPRLQALLLAERVYEDKHTGKKIITGIFNRVVVSVETQQANAERQDAKRATEADRVRAKRQAGSPYAYINLTEVRGQVPLRLSYIDLQDGRELMHCDFSAKSDSPLDNIEIVVEMPMLPIPHLGVYVLELLHNEELIGALRVIVESDGSDE